jgi:hypothetical protein
MTFIVHGGPHQTAQRPGGLGLIRAFETPLARWVSIATRRDAGFTSAAATESGVRIESTWRMVCGGP